MRSSSAVYIGSGEERVTRPALLDAGRAQLLLGAEGVAWNCGRVRNRTAETHIQVAAQPSRHPPKDLIAWNSGTCRSPYLQDSCPRPCGSGSRGRAWPALATERQRERRAGAVRLVLDRLEAGVRAGACSDPSKSRGIDNTASLVEAAAVDQRRNACPVGERTVASMRHDGQEQQPRPCPGRLLLKTRPDSVAVTGRCSCFAAGEQQYLLLAGAGTAVLPLRRAKEGALRAPSRSCASRPNRRCARHPCGTSALMGRAFARCVERGRRRHPGRACSMVATEQAPARWTVSVFAQSGHLVAANSIAARCSTPPGSASPTHSTPSRRRRRS
jgi:hypothetical protein